MAERMSVSDSRHLPPSSLLQIARDQVCCAEVINMLSARVACKKRLFPIREILNTVNLGGARGPYCGVPLEAQGLQLGHQVFYKQVKMEDHTITKEDLQGHQELSGKSDENKSF